MANNNLEVALACPRKAFLSDMSTGAQKYSQLRAIMKEAVLQVKPGMTKAEVQKVVDDLFAAKGNAMFAFEAAGEKNRMGFLINRYNDWESHSPYSRILASDVLVDVDFAGKPRKVSVHRLIDRGHGEIEAVRYSYKSPKTSVRSKINHPSTSVELLLLQLVLLLVVELAARFSVK